MALDELNLPQTVVVQEVAEWQDIESTHSARIGSYLVENRLTVLIRAREAFQAHGVSIRATMHHNAESYFERSRQITHPEQVLRVVIQPDLRFYNADFYPEFQISEVLRAEIPESEED